MYAHIFCITWTLPLYFLIMTKRGRYRIALLRGRRNFKQLWSFNYFKQWIIWLRGSVYQKHMNLLQTFNSMHDILIEFLIDVSKGGAINWNFIFKRNEEKNYERGRIMKFIQACKHSFKSLHTCNLFQKDQCFVIIKKGEIVDSRMILMITIHWVYWHLAKFVIL